MSRRLKAIGVSSKLLVDMMRQDYEIKDGIRNIEGVPTDAVFVYTFTEGGGDVYYVFEHPTFAELELGDSIPKTHITLMRIVKAPAEERQVFSSEQIRRGLP